MDTRAANESVEAKLAMIKNQMPLTYQAIKTKAEQIGNDAYVWVRQGLRGMPDRFFAIEAGQVVGTPFVRGDVMVELERWLLLYGRVDVCFFATEGVLS